MEFHSYLFISGGRCREAFEHYQQVLGGELAIMPFSELPEGEDAPVDDSQRDLVMHAGLTIGDALLMGSDDPTGDGGPMRGVAVHLSVDPAEETERVFGALAEGGEVTMPMEKTFWAERFGACTDRFGVPWMVSTS